MLRTTCTASILRTGTDPNREGQAADITDFAWVQRYPIILFCALLGVLDRAIYLLGTPPQYTAHTDLIVDARKGQFFQQQSILAYAPTDTS